MGVVDPAWLAGVLFFKRGQEIWYARCISSPLQPGTEGLKMAGRTPRLTVLIVEDDFFSRHGLTRLLEGAGYGVVATADGKQALQVLHSGKVPDLILLDMLLPILDGWHFLDQFRADAKWSTVPIIVMTGIVLGPEWAQAHGCAGFLKKPIDEGSLFAEIDRCLLSVASEL
jgi:CheY-like chemotaxis protein